MSNKKRLDKSNILRGSIFCACLSIILLSTNITASAKIVKTPQILMTATTNEPDIIGYVGNVTGRVNVRVGAGEKNDRVKQNGKEVRLERGDKVVIIGEEMVGSKPWYHINFEKNGEELTGYATSTYIKKTSTAITPEPTATPKPTATPEPSPTENPTLTPTPSELPAKNTNQNDSNNESKKMIYIGILLVSVLGLGAISVAIYKKKKDDSEYIQEGLTDKLEQLKNLKLEKENDSKVNNNTVVKNNTASKAKSNIVSSFEGKKLDNKNGKNKKSDSKSNVIKKEEAKVQPKVSEEFAVTTEPIEQQKVIVVHPNKQRLESGKESGSKDSEEKKALREQIQKLREHDIVIHKYFGRGEVFDNSDVRLIEVRFGGDVRFLNKETLASKKLLTITNERNL